MKIKDGVIFDEVNPETWFAAGFLCATYIALAVKECIVTSMRDGIHSANSKHYIGDALDARTRHLTEQDRQHILAFVKLWLDPMGYDTVLEADHIHCEFDKKPGEKFIDRVT